MGIPGFFKWLINTFPECLLKDKKSFSRCNTLFIDLCQISFRSSEFVEKKYKTSSPEEQMNFFLSDLVTRVNNTILTINPTDTIFAFFDGSNPAIKFQRQRERWFKREHIDNYVIDPTEYKLSDNNTDRDEFQIKKLDEFFEQITHNCKYLRAKRILFSTFYAPGEAEHKYLDVFRDFKRQQFWRPNQLHTIFTTDNDLIFLALQFLDEHFLIIRDFNNIIDISILRDLLLYQIFQDQNLYQGENRITVAHDLVSHIPVDFQQQVINDIIALSFIVGNDYLPPVPDFSTLFSFSKLIDSYKRVNEKYFSKIISKIQDTTTEASFSPLIVNDSICVETLQKIIHECFNRPLQNPNLDSSNNQSNEQTNNNSQMTSNTDEIDDVKTPLINKLHINTDTNYKNEDETKIQDITTNNNDNSNSLQESNPQSPEIDNLDEKSQQMLRTFNFTWLYYSKGCPSWSFYYPFKKSPPLRKAIFLMKQEGPEVFKTPGYNEMTEPMFKIFVLHPVECKECLSWCFYKMKIPPSDISHFWPLGAKNVNDIPMFDLNVMKEYYKEGKKQARKEELMKYNRIDPMYKKYVNMNHNYTQKKSKYHFSPT